MHKGSLQVNSGFNRHAAKIKHFEFEKLVFILEVVNETHIAKAEESLKNALSVESLSSLPSWTRVVGADFFRWRQYGLK